MFNVLLKALAFAIVFFVVVTALGLTSLIDHGDLIAAILAALVVLAIVAGVRRLATLATSVLVVVSLAGCAALGGGAGGQGFADLVKSIATDPRCGHEDSIQFVAGVLSGSASRHCPIPAAGPAPAPTGAPAPVPASEPSPA